MKGKKKILIISKFFHPEITPRSFRATELAKEFARQGHNVTVWLPDKGIDYTDFEKKHKLNIHYMGRLKWKRISNEGRFKMIKRGVRRSLQLLLEYPDLELMLMTNRALRKLRKGEAFDLLISIAVPYPIHWGVALARSKKRILAKTWVADCGDPYMGEATDTFRKLFYFKYVEKWFMRKTDFITIPVESSKQGYYFEFYPKIRIIPQGFKIDTLIKSENYKLHAIPHFAFAGNFNTKLRDPRPFLNFLTTLEKDFVFFIYTRRKDVIEPYIKGLGKRIVVSDYIPRKELLPKLASMNFLINFDNETNIQLPSKLIDYYISKRPILNITKKLDKNKILEFLAGDYSHALPMKNIDNYRIEKICSFFLRLNNDNNAEK